MDLNTRQMDDFLKMAVVNATDEELKVAEEWLRQLYNTVGYDGDVEERISVVIEKATKGWPRASKNFFKRLRQTVGGRTLKAFESKLELQRKLDENQMTDDEYIDFVTTKELNKEKDKTKEKKINFTESISDYLQDEKERDFWKSREQSYFEEFDFNESSDRILLDQLIYLEVLLRRARIGRLSGNTQRDLDEVKLLDDHRKTAEKLGILRIQRMSADQNVEGNVGEISMALEEKLQEMKELKDENVLNKTIQRINAKFKKLTFYEIQKMIEEQSLLREVEELPPLNIIPQAELNALHKKIVKGGEEDG